MELFSNLDRILLSHCVSRPSPDVSNLNLERDKIKIQLSWTISCLIDRKLRQRHFHHKEFYPMSGIETYLQTENFFERRSSRSCS